LDFDQVITLIQHFLSKTLKKLYVRWFHVIGNI